MELPTYTNIWKIEKRLYKLYDFRLPMPLPVGQVAAFLAIAVPYTLILTMAGMPFSHTWLWLYVLPPGLLAWLVTRPVLEGKRLPELVLSQTRYLTEPRTWCRMAPLTEKDEVAVSATVWRRSTVAQLAEPTEAGAATAGQAALTGAAAVAAAPSPRTRREPARRREVATAAAPVRTGAATADGDIAGGGNARSDGDGIDGGRGDSARGDSARGDSAASDLARPSWPARPAIGTRARATAAGAPPQQQAGQPAPPQPVSAQAVPPQGVPPHPGHDQDQPAPGRAEPRWPGPPATPGQSRQAAKVRPALTVRAEASASGPLNVVERALRTPRADGWHERVVVVPGGHRPGKPDQVQRDQSRARLPVAGPARMVVLGCTGGAGQTVITLLTGQLLTSLRGEPVAVLDLHAGPGSLTERAREIPKLLPGRRSTGAAAGTGGPGQTPSTRERGLQVVTADSQADRDEDAGKLIEAVVARYQLTLADPNAGHVPRALHVADQLILVAPASADAAGALAMTLEWLEAHGHAALARSAVTVLNGTSEHTGPYVDKAAAVAAGRCRAVVRVPWDEGLADSRPLAVATVQAFTALAGVLVAGLAEAAAAGRAER